MFEVKFSSTPEELQAIINLRYEVLRLPWNQPKDTASDELEGSSHNAYITDHGQVIACGRLQENANSVGQIRYMAVSDLHQGKGLGKLIVRSLEKKALELGLTTIELQARENAVDFYKSCGYSIKEKSFLLWGEIQHYLMAKSIRN